MLNVNNPEDRLSFAIDGEEQVYSIPFPKNLPLSYAKRLAALAAEGTDQRSAAFMDIFVEVLDRFAPGASDRLSAAAAAQVLKAWAGEDLGE